MNKIKIRINDNDQFINIPVELDWDMSGRDDLINQYEDEVIRQVINPVEDFEVERHSHAKWIDPTTSKYHTNITYNFYFYDYMDEVSASTITQNNWAINYGSSQLSPFSSNSFTNKEIYYNSNSFSRSFFKLDFYDTKESDTQQIFLTIIIPTHQGVKTGANIGTTIVPKQVDINTPQFILDFVGDKEGYFIYWLKDKTYVNLSEFYVSCKFFNAKIGQFVRFINRPQSNIQQRFNFKQSDFFYYKVTLDDSDFTYQINKTFGNIGRVGSTNEPINWYEYVNPQ